LLHLGDDVRGVARQAALRAQCCCSRSFDCFIDERLWRFRGIEEAAGRGSWGAAESGQRVRPTGSTRRAIPRYAQINDPFTVPRITLRLLCCLS
jgi:hypothetical protein